MSFDSEFVYQPIIDGCTQRITELQNQINQNTINKNTLENSTYASYVDNDIIVLNNLITEDNLSIIGYQAIIDEINRIYNLPIEDKELIYYFYTVLGVPKNKYMIKLLFNTDKIADSRVQTVYNDNTINNQTKLLIAQKLYEQFTIYSLYKEVLYVSAYLS